MSRLARRVMPLVARAITSPRTRDAARWVFERRRRLWGERRCRMGHDLGAMFFYGGEWYRGVDRLHHPERRLGAPQAASATPG